MTNRVNNNQNYVMKKKKKNQLYQPKFKQNLYSETTNENFETN